VLLPSREHQDGDSEPHGLHPHCVWSLVRRLEIAAGRAQERPCSGGAWRPVGARPHTKKSYRIGQEAVGKKQRETGRTGRVRWWAALPHLPSPGGTHTRHKQAVASPCGWG
jgi:hypothetical protein